MEGLEALLNASLYGESPKTPSTSRSQRSVTGKRQTSYCHVCEKQIVQEGKRSQGPRRHILQHHLNRPLFACPHCPATSNYDKAHIVNHIGRMHRDLGGQVIVESRENYAEEEAEWMKRCFGGERKAEPKKMKNVEGKWETPRSTSVSSTCSSGSLSSSSGTEERSPSPTPSSENPGNQLMPTWLGNLMLPTVLPPPQDFPPGPLTPDQLVLFHMLFMANMFPDFASSLAVAAPPENPDSN